MSGHGDRATLERGVIDDVPLLEKPFSAAALATRVREVLGPVDSTATPSVG
jgi:hypothetical protein